MEDETPVKKENQKPLIRRPNYPVRTKGVHEWTPDCLPKHLAMLIIGRPDSGKTHLLYELLTNVDLYCKKFNRILFFTP